MEEILTHARFADLAAVEERGLTATVPRSEIEDAVREAEGQPELLLDVRLSGGNGDRRVENRRVSIEWERADLEALLRQARGESVTFAVDTDSLVRALETSEVEAHGIREAAAAVTVALAVAAPAAAAVGGPGADQPGIPAGFSTVEQTRGAEGGTAPEGIPAGFDRVEQTRGVEGGTAPEGIPAGFSTVEDIRGVEGGTAPEGIPPGFDRVEQTRGVEGGTAPEGIPAGFDRVEQTRGVEGGTAVTPVARPTGRVDPSTVGAGESVTISAPDLAAGLGIAGAITLAIAGAAFAVRGRGREQPA
jgi:hypothetical protein